jgi:hypothetical protein
LDDEDILLLETIAERLRKKARSKRTRRKKMTESDMPMSEDVLVATDGAWKDSLYCADLKRRLYENRLAL